ncbi:PQQ-dependent sugar dehydrogenase [Marinobacterium sediminicola]|uniref:Glucose/arabinose dehydrogenase, beta-propeller fold n=1 Tax=Marinobacterium sediminicola TaxID=518898 RepID=A0ABY1S3L9_9GAMM|nr:PQQ-dependent sugar dehydrogenase [Marinobacterium sediminicola]ULG69266.1 PQQ-dependent sugar dehydrogenase [Marinobacterium sediminicola]SMR77615.1 Glucose/arabinose dehydrogenase, beta-propeller fold [Marinobacterium sediminicola]
MMRWLLLLILPPLTGFSEALPLERLQLPPGYRIEVVAEVPDARQMTLSPSGTLYVGTRRDGRVFALQDLDGDQRYERRYTLLSRRRLPNGVAWSEGDLYIAELTGLIRLNDIDSRLADPPAPEMVLDNLPDITHHGWKYLKQGPDGAFYFTLGAPCNACLHTDPRFASIMRFDPETGESAPWIRGVRNSVGFAWHPEDGSLWFTDNGRDHLGDDQPDDELNRAEQGGLHFGFPFVHGNGLPDPLFGDGSRAINSEPPVALLGAHVAALGISFYTATQFPDTPNTTLFMAQHGSWNRSSKVGYRVMRIATAGDKVLSVEAFITGWRQGERAWGRPVDVLIEPDGDLLISDDKADVIYRVWYNPSN